MPKSSLVAVAALGSTMLLAGIALAVPPTLEAPQPIKPPPVAAPTVRPIFDAGAPARVPCVVTHAGADGNGTRTCTLTAQWDTATKQGGLLLKGVAGYGPTITPDAIFRLTPNAPAVGPLPSPLAYSMSYQTIVPPQTTPVMFLASSGVGNLPAQGSASVNLTSVAPAGAPTGTTQEYTVHGTIDATLPAFTPSHASGTVTVHVSF